jgi:PAS domain S-box-containing protein
VPGDPQESGPPAAPAPTRSPVTAQEPDAAPAFDDPHDAADASHVLGELAIAAARIGTFDWDLEGGVLNWDDELISLFGYDRNTFDRTIGGFNAAVHPHDLPRVNHAIDAAIETCGEYDAEFRVVLPDGRTRWVAARGRALCGPDGTPRRLFGAAYETTARQESQARVARVLEAMPTAFYSVDRDWRFTYVNAEAERLLGRPREELLGGVLWELFPGAVGSEFETNYRRAVAEGRPVTFDAYYPEPLDGWYELQAWPGPDGLSVYFVDITARRRAQHEAERAAARAELMARVTTELSETLEGDQAVIRLAQLLVPGLADWCIVTLVDDDEQAGARRGLRDVGWWHADAAQRSQLDAYAAVRLDALLDASFLSQALETGRPVTVPTDATERVSAVLAPGPARDALRALAPQELRILPLRGRGGLVGLVTLATGAGRAAPGPDDVATAQEIAGRAGLALDNSRLYRQQRQLAEGLQRSMLTAPPEPDHMQIVVRYEPAARAAQVGGDWYDAFLQRDGATVLVIGDVVGHDVAAAAAMGQVRSLLRGIGVATGYGPAALLREVDQAMRTLQTDTIATAVVARVEQTDDERHRGVTHIRWANAGHPPPMVVNQDGTVAVLAGIRPDPLLGVLPDVQRVESEIAVDRGATVLLYTDGLVERRERSLVEGMEALREVLLELSHLELEDLCDAILDRLLPERPDDDVALVAVRLHRQDRPRPAEAGPNRVPPDVPDAPEIEDQPG